MLRAALGLAEVHTQNPAFICHRNIEDVCAATIRPGAGRNLHILRTPIPGRPGSGCRNVRIYLHERAVQGHPDRIAGAVTEVVDDLQRVELAEREVAALVGDELENVTTWCISRRVPTRVVGAVSEMP